MDFFDTARKTDLVGGIKKKRKSSGLFLEDAQIEDNWTTKKAQLTQADLENIRRKRFYVWADSLAAA